ncbi:MAG: hypothetical protein AAB676_15565 [Verrucomicrobiota bacterium]
MKYARVGFLLVVVLTALVAWWFQHRQTPGRPERARSVPKLEAEAQHPLQTPAQEPDTAQHLQAAPHRLLEAAAPPQAWQAAQKY